MRRFLATFGDYAIRENVKVELDCKGEKFKAEGIRTVKPGWYLLYGPYAKIKEVELPELKEGDILPVTRTELEEKVTQPPKRYTPASIIKKLETHNLGTKATRSQIIDILYKRGYVDGKSIQVTPLGLKVVETLEKYCPEVLDEQLTRHFEDQMAKIMEGKLSEEEVLKEGRKTLIEITAQFKEKEKEVGIALAQALRAGELESNSLGKCFKCDGVLLLRKGRNGSQFIGCSNYPECTYTMPLPKNRKFKKITKCPHCGYAILSTYMGKGKKPFQFCINPRCPAKKNLSWRI